MMLILVPSWNAKRVTLLPFKDLVSDLSGTRAFNDMVHSRARLLDLRRLGSWVKSLS